MLSVLWTGSAPPRASHMLGLDQAVVVKVFFPIHGLQLQFLSTRPQSAAQSAVNFLRPQSSRATRGQQPELNHQQPICHLATACGGQFGESLYEALSYFLSFLPVPWALCHECLVFALPSRHFEGDLPSQGIRSEARGLTCHASGLDVTHNARLISITYLNIAAAHTLTVNT
jgi:hypothetical protein